MTTITQILEEHDDRDRVLRLGMRGHSDFTSIFRATSELQRRGWRCDAWFHEWEHPDHEGVFSLVQACRISVRWRGDARTEPPLGRSGGHSP